MTKLAALPALALAAAALASCGGGDSTVASDASSTVKIESDPNATFTYTTTEEVAKAGEVTIHFKNPQSFEHVVKLENAEGGAFAGETKGVVDGSTTTVTELKPDTYIYYCSFPGHRKAGMEGTLTVE